MTRSQRLDDGAGGTDALTPDTWRRAALAMLLGGGAAGLLASRRPFERLVRLIPVGLLVAAAGVLVGSRRAPLEPGAPPLDPAAPPLTMSIVVAARDEASVIGRLVRDVAEQDHRAADGRPLFELLIVDDRSIDDTGQVALRAAAEAGIGDVVRYIPRGNGTPDGGAVSGDLADGKGAALTAAQPELCRGDVVVVLDADARIGPSFLRRLAAYVAAGADAVTARRRIASADLGQLAGAQADEQTADGLIQRGRWALGGCSEFRGDGITVRRELLAAVGGWRAAALTEDLDLSSRVAAVRGITVAWAIDAEVWEEPVTLLGDLWRQRTRWAEGALRRLFEHGPAVLSSPVLSPRARLDFATYSVQLLVPPFGLGAVAAALLGRPRVLIVLGTTYLGVGTLLAFDALRWETDDAGRPLPLDQRAYRAARTAAFGGLWLAAVPAAMWRIATHRGPIRYEKMTHAGHVHPPRPRRDPSPPGRAG